MTICYLADALSIHTQRWASHFASRGYHVHVISFSPHSIPGVNVHVAAPLTSIKQFGYPLLLPKVRHLIREVRPDVIHAHYVTSYGLLGAMSQYHPFVLTAWGSDILLAPSQSMIRKIAVLLTLRHADLVTSMATHMMQKLAALGVPQEKIFTMTFGVDRNVFNPSLRDHTTEDVDIVCTRAFKPVYNVQLLIRALPHVIRHRPGVRCALIGSGPMLSELQGLARKLGVDANIRWVGNVQEGEMAVWLARARVFVTPSLSDGNSISLNEAMACGSFPIASDIPANREWLEDGRNGFIVPADSPEALAESILKALEDGGLRRVAAERNWSIVQEHADWHKNCALMEERYWELVSSSRHK